MTDEILFTDTVKRRRCPIKIILINETRILPNTTLSGTNRVYGIRNRTWKFLNSVWRPNYVYNILRCRRFNSQAQLSSIAFELLCGSRKHAPSSPSQLTPASSCGITQSVPRRSVQSTQRANIAASRRVHGPSTWTFSSGSPDPWCTTRRSVHPWTQTTSHSTPIRIAVGCLKTVYPLS